MTSVASPYIPRTLRNASASLRAAHSTRKRSVLNPTLSMTNSDTGWLEYHAKREEIEYIREEGDLEKVSGWQNEDRDREVRKLNRRCSRW